MATFYHIRSCSLPARHNSNGLNQIQTLLINLPTDSNSLSLLSQLYTSVSHHFNDSPSSLLLPHHSVFTHLLDISLVHLDLCSKLRDITCRIKDCLRDLRSAFRRGHGEDSTILCHVKAFIRFRKVVRKDLSKLLLLLRQTDHSPSSESSHPLITLLRQVCSQTCHSFRTVLLSLSTSGTKHRPSRWALVTNLMTKKVNDTTSVQVQTGHRNEFHLLDEELRRFSMAKEIKKERIKSLINNFDRVDAVVEDLEDSLERLYRRMIEARVSLLNILSSHI